MSATARSTPSAAAPHWIELLAECAALEAFRHHSENLYERVRACFFLYAIHRFHLPARPELATSVVFPFHGYVHLLERRFEEAIALFLQTQDAAWAER